MMAKRKSANGSADANVVDYRHKGVSRLNIPPAGLAARGEIAREPKLKWAYNPHLAPALRFDAAGAPDALQGIVDAASRRVLTPEELATLSAALRTHEPWLEWAGKREQPYCVADPVALHIHERLSTQAVLKIAKRLDVQRDLFADPEQDYREAVQFYRHAMDWTNRMILGDSLAVMASLSRREALAGKVQMIYMDPPYGIKYASNFQPEVGKRDVKDKEEDLTREPEMVKAYRDTWTLGVHSYLSYLRDRLLMCKELLADSGSVFVQIGEENLHRVRLIMEELFGEANFVGEIAFVTTGGFETDGLSNPCNYLLWFSKNRDKFRYKRIFTIADRQIGLYGYRWVQTPEGEMRGLKQEEVDKICSIPEGGRVYKPDNIKSSGASQTEQVFTHAGRTYSPGPNNHWKTNLDGLKRLAGAGRIHVAENSIAYIRFPDDFPVRELSSLWLDTATGNFTGEKIYVVQTNTDVIARCMHMTTDPGDLVIDPTCGSGTTAQVAENWGRRWITIDVSRVALAIARQRLLTAKFDYFKLRPTSAEDVRRNPDGPWLADPDREITGTCTFDCKTVPHVTLKSIAQNPALDPIFDKWEPLLAEKLASLNAALKSVTKDTRQQLALKLAAKEKAEGKKAVTDADRRRWLLPAASWQAWEAPFDTDPDWPKPLQAALTAYRQAWRQKMDEVNACIAARADQEELVDQPAVARNRVRVCGPFTMEGVIPAEESIDDEEAGEVSPIGGAPAALETFGADGSPIRADEGGFVEAASTIADDPQNAEAYLDKMIRLLRGDGVRFPDNKVMHFSELERLTDGSSLHARGVWANGDKKQRLVAVLVGPQYGALNAMLVEEGIGRARRGGYDDLVFAAFSFDGAAQALIQDDPDPKLRIHMAQIRPDVNMGDLLKTTASSQLFTVSGSPRTRIEKSEESGRDARAPMYTVTMEGVDIYDPVTNVVRSTGAEKVAAWFLDSDYDGRCFCVCQAFFPDKDAWSKLGKALGGTLDEDAFAKLSGTVSLPFPEGDYKRIAVKVIDPRGNEVLRVHRLDGKYD
jgi:adenine-specific DNA-methyltransferase